MRERFRPGIRPADFKIGRKPLTTEGLGVLAIEMNGLEQSGKIELQRGSGVTRPTKRQ